LDVKICSFDKMFVHLMLRGFQQCAGEKYFF
jgi:hypothetical protein